MKLLNSRPGTWYKYNGINHGIYAIGAFIVGCLILSYIGLLIPLYLGYLSLGILIYFFFEEMRQEYKMVKKDETRYKHWYNFLKWSDDRYQDLIFVFIFLVVCNIIRYIAI